MSSSHIQTVAIRYCNKQNIFEVPQPKLPLEWKPGTAQRVIKLPSDYTAAEMLVCLAAKPEEQIKRDKVHLRTFPKEVCAAINQGKNSETVSINDCPHIQPNEIVDPSVIYIVVHQNEV